MHKFPHKIVYSRKLTKGQYLYRKVILTQQLFHRIDISKTLSQKQWRDLGIQGSMGWQHYKYDPSYPHVLIFRKKNKPNPLQNIQLLSIISSIVQNNNDSQIILFRRESEQIVTERSTIMDGKTNKQQQSECNKQQSFDVPQIKLFGRSSSPSSNKTLRSINYQLQNNNYSLKINNRNHMNTFKQKQQSFILKQKYNNQSQFTRSITPNTLKQIKRPQSYYNSTITNRSIYKSVQKHHNLQFKSKIKPMKQPQTIKNRSLKQILQNQNKYKYQQRKDKGKTLRLEQFLLDLQKR